MSKSLESCMGAMELYIYVLRTALHKKCCVTTDVPELRIEENKYSGNRESHQRHYAGTVHSNKFILILCEGLSAMSGVLGGLSDDDKNV
jgi:hypothetical protein